METRSKTWTGFCLAVCLAACLLLPACYQAITDNSPELAFTALQTGTPGSGCVVKYRATIMNTGGLVGYWPLDEATGTTGVNQVAGGPDFTYVSGVTPGVTGFAADGSSLAITTAAAGSQITSTTVATTQTDNVSLEIWINWDGDLSGGTGLVLLYNGHTGTAGYGLILDVTGFFFVLMGGQGAAETTYRPPANAWTHLAAVRDNGTWRLFANAQELSTTGLFNPNPVSGRIMLGVNQLPVQEYFGGKLDEAAIYTVALSPADIASHYAAGCY